MLVSFSIPYIPFVHTGLAFTSNAAVGDTKEKALYEFPQKNTPQSTRGQPSDGFRDVPSAWWSLRLQQLRCHATHRPPTSQETPPSSVRKILYVCVLSVDHNLSFQFTLAYASSPKFQKKVERMFIKTANSFATCFLSETPFTYPGKDREDEFKDLAQAVSINSSTSSVNKFEFSVYDTQDKICVFSDRKYKEQMSRFWEIFLTRLSEEGRKVGLRKTTPNFTQDPLYVYVSSEEQELDFHFVIAHPTTKEFYEEVLGFFQQNEAFSFIFSKEHNPSPDATDIPLIHAFSTNQGNSLVQKKELCVRPKGVNISVFYHKVYESQMNVFWSTCMKNLVQNSAPTPDTNGIFDEMNWKEKMDMDSHFLYGLPQSVREEPNVAATLQPLLQQLGELIDKISKALK